MLSLFRRLKCFLGFHEWDFTSGLGVVGRSALSTKTWVRYYCIHCRREIRAKEEVRRTPMTEPDAVGEQFEKLVSMLHQVLTELYAFMAIIRAKYKEVP